MKKNLLLFFFTTLLLQAQENVKTWTEVLSEANQTQKKILLVFSGSDWCVPCIKLDREILSTGYFKKNATGYFIIYKADFPRRKKNQLPPKQRKQNEMLAEKYNPEGIFPLVVVLNSEGKPLGQMAYEKISPQEYLKKLLSF